MRTFADVKSSCQRGRGKFQTIRLLATALLLLPTSAFNANVAPAAVVMDVVPVGNPGNPPDTRYESVGIGGVDYIFNIGKYEVTNAQYCELLNSVATVGDPHELYNEEMGRGHYNIGGISRSGSGTEEDPWVYAPREHRANRPVNYVSFWDACRFANWLHNGQPRGVQDLDTTEDGAHFLGGVTHPNNTDVHRATGW